MFHAGLTDASWYRAYIPGEHNAEGRRFGTPDFRGTVKLTCTVLPQANAYATIRRGAGIATKLGNDSRTAPHSKRPLRWRTVLTQGRQACITAALDPGPLTPLRYPPILLLHARSAPHIRSRRPARRAHRFLGRLARYEGLHDAQSSALQNANMRFGTK
jgi:hypothetical protein